jgi:predicted nucleic acid-binding protein
VDANLIAALFLPLPYSVRARERIATWQQSAVELIAPLLFEYEMTTVLRKAIVTGVLTAGSAEEAMYETMELGIQRLSPTPQLHKSALAWAARLGHSKAYDAHYLALAEREQAELWTADRRLSNAARQAGATWVHWTGE